MIRTTEKKREGRCPRWKSSVAKKKSKENDYIDCCSNDKLFNVPSSLICNVFLEPTSHAKQVGDRNPTAA